MLFVIFVVVRGASNMILKNIATDKLSRVPQVASINTTHEPKYPTEVMSENDDIYYSTWRHALILFKYIPLNNGNNLAYTSNSKCKNISCSVFGGWKTMQLVTYKDKIGVPQ